MTDSCRSRSEQGAYIPMEKWEIEDARHNIHGLLKTGDLAHSTIDRLCDMALNALLYAEEINRLRVMRSETPRIWMVSSKTMCLPFATAEAAQKYVAGFPASVSGGMEITEMTVHG
jgi:hypothetical protein